MNDRSKRFSRTNLSRLEGVNSKLQKLTSIRNKTNTMMIQSDLFRKTNNKLKRSIHRKPMESITKKISLSPLPGPSIKKNLSTTKKYSNSQEPTIQSYSTMSKSYLATSQLLSSPTNDERSVSSIIHPTLNSEHVLTKDKVSDDFQEDSQISKFPHRTTRSITSSSSASKSSRDEPLLAPDTLIIDKLYILNERYPSIDHERMTGTPIAFLSAEKFLRTRVDWTKVQYPLSSSSIELIIDLLIARPSFIREIPNVTEYNLYRSLMKTISGHLFFDHGENKAAIHQCDRKLINRKFTIEDLASIHRREFHILNYNATHEQRFVNLYENLFPIHVYQSTSNHWKTYLVKPKHHPTSASDIISDMSLDNSEIHHINTLLTLNRTLSPVISMQKRSSRSKKSIRSEQSSAITSPAVPK